MKTMTIPLRGGRLRALTAFNPALPVDGSLVEAGELRDQFNGLAALIAAIPSVDAAVVDDVTTLPPGDPAGAGVALTGGTLHFTFEIPQGYDGNTGPEGPQGPEGPPFAQAVVDGVNTLPPGDPATVDVTYDGTNVHFTFGIPQGYDGNPGSDGPQGPEGPPFAQAVVDGVNTLYPSEPATVGVTYDGADVHFTFGIPQGYQGDTGPQGEQGPPGEVTLSELTTACDNVLANSSNQSNEVPPLDMAVSDPPTQWEVEQIVSKLNELIQALRRT